MSPIVAPTAIAEELISSRMVFFSLAKQPNFIVDEIVAMPFCRFLWKIVIHPLSRDRDVRPIRAGHARPAPRRWGRGGAWAQDEYEGSTLQLCSDQSAIRRFSSTR